MLQCCAWHQAESIKAGTFLINTNITVGQWKCLRRFEWKENDVDDSGEDEKEEEEKEEKEREVLGLLITSVL